MSASYIPSDRTAHVLARLLEGQPLNGTAPESIDPLFRGMALRINELAGREPAALAEALHAELIYTGLTEQEQVPLLRAIRGQATSTPTPAPDRPLLQFLRGPELRTLPPLEWLIHGLIPRASTVAMYGPAGKGKSFLMLHIACHLALGWRWYGREVKQGPVIYFAAEGQMGMRQRYIAWCARYHNGQDVPDFILCPQPMYPTAEEFVQALYGYLDSLVSAQPTLIVFDTLFRCFEGDENATADMGKFIRATDAIRMRTNAAIGLVHHTGWNATRMRGNSALLGALDVAMRVDQDELGTISLACEKMKDAEAFTPWYFDLTPIPGTESVAATLARDNRPPLGSVFNLPDTHMLVLGLVIRGGAGGVGFGDLKRESGIKRDQSVADILRALERGGFVRTEGDVGTKGRRYAPTAKGVMASQNHSGSTPGANGEITADGH